MQSAHSAVPVTTSVIGFTALLREYGFSAGVAEQQAMLQAAFCIGSLRESALSAAWRAIVCHRQQEWHQWPELFVRYWHPQRLRGSVRVSGHTRPRPDLRQAVNELQNRLQQDTVDCSGSNATNNLKASALMPEHHLAHGQENPSLQAQGGASAIDGLHKREQQMWWPHDLGALQQLARRIHRQLRPLPVRRWHTIVRPGKRLNLRRTLRRSIAWGGDFMTLAWQVRQTIPPNLFILVDVSRSMESHAAFFLRVARAFAREAQAQVSIFHVRLAEITSLLQRDNACVQEKINAVIAGFGAGTRIGTCLQTFAQGPARAQLRRATHVWVMSDGYDTDDPEILAQALRSLRRRGVRTTWFHPTRQWPASTALQHVRSDIEHSFALANLQDLSAACPHLH